MVGYDGTSPGPTFRINRDTETVVRYVNKYDRPSSVHLHGSYSRAPFDGWAADVIEPGEYKDYYFPNAQRARTLWYHDHAEHITAVNAYSGQAGFYIIEDDQAETLGLPTGDYDIPLMLQAKEYTKTGQLTDISTERDSLYGDIFQVNGQIAPYFAVEPRKYRFRLLNAAASRTFNLTLQDADENVVPVTVVGADGGISFKSVQTPNLIMAMAERWEVVIDFAEFRGQNLTLGSRTETDARNGARLFFDTDYWNEGFGPVMQFNVKDSDPISEVGNGAVPEALATDITRGVTHTEVDQAYFFTRIGATVATREWIIQVTNDGQTEQRRFNDPNNRIIRNVPRGTTEHWTFRSGGGWSHPIHVHLVDFEITERTGGRGGRSAYEIEAVKDVVSVGAGETVHVNAIFAPWDGVYMFHCHNLVHEDTDMMGAFNVTNLPSLGYNDTRFNDPMEQQFRAVPYTEAASEEAAIEVLQKFADFEAYEHEEEIEASLNAYHAALPERTSGAYVPLKTIAARRVRRRL